MSDAIKDTMPQMCSLLDRRCMPCHGGVPPLKDKALEHFRSQLGEGWALVGDHHIEKQFTFDNWRQALDFTNQVGNLADREDHHPDILLTWGKVKITLWTHKIDGLSENDFILAAKIDQLHGR